MSSCITTTATVTALRRGCSLYGTAQAGRKAAVCSLPTTFSAAARRRGRFTPYFPYTAIGPVQRINAPFSLGVSGAGRANRNPQDGYFFIIGSGQGPKAWHRRTAVRHGCSCRCIGTFLVENLSIEPIFCFHSSYKTRTTSPH